MGARPPLLKEKSAAADLSVLFGCHGYVVAVPARRVERLVLSEEVTLCASTPEAGAVAVVKVGTTRYASWNFGRMLELPLLKQAWVLLRIPHGGAELPMALSVGACLLVSPVKEVTPLPPGMFKERRSALWGSFPTAAVKGKLGTALMGLCLDPLRLWTREELDQSAAALIAAHAK